MTSALGFAALAFIFAIPGALIAWAIARKWSPRERGPRSGRSIIIEVAGAIVGQVFGLALFYAFTAFQAAGDIDVVNGIVGYGTLLFSPWAGVGTWGLAAALGGRPAHPARALFCSCGCAFGAVLAFFSAAGAFQLDGERWMAVYALAPVFGAVVGYRVGALGIPSSTTRAGPSS